MLDVHAEIRDNLHGSIALSVLENLVISHMRRDAAFAAVFARLRFSIWLFLVQRTHALNTRWVYCTLLPLRGVNFTITKNS